MKCNTCNEAFNEAVLSEVLIHEHSGIINIKNAAEINEIEGECVGKKYNEDQSLNILEVTFSKKSLYFDVTYKNKKTYRYFDFPIILFNEAIKSSNIGKFLAAKVKGNFRYCCIRG